MNFLNPLVLAGLAAAAVPLLFHLLSKRRIREVPFPSIRFLRLLQSDRIRLLNLKQLLVLILRTLIVVFVVLGFARPALRSTFTANARTSAVVIVDATASMTYIDDGEMLFNRAKRIAAEILGYMRNGDTAAVVAAGRDPFVLEPGMTDDIRLLVNRLDALEPSFTAGSPDRAFERAFDLLGSARTVNRELYYLSDGDGDSLPDSLTGDESIRLYIVALGLPEHRGAVVDDLRLIDRIVSPGRPLTFQAGGRIGSDTADAEVSFFVDGERKQQTRVTPQADGKFTAEFVYTPESPGWYSVAASVGEGYFEAGETRRITVHIPMAVRVTIVAEGLANGYFLERILAPAAADSAFAVRMMDAGNVETGNITWADVIVLSGVEELPVPVTDALVNGVLGGGKGLIAIPPEDASTPLYRDVIFRDMFPLDGYSSVDLRAREGIHELAVERYDFTHPIMRGISEQGQFTPPVVESFLEVIPPSGTRVFARYNDNTMAAGDLDAGNGRVILLTADVSSLTGELAFTGIFVPLFVRSVQYLSDTLPDAGQDETGRPFEVTFPIDEQVSQVTLKRDDLPAVLVGFERRGARAIINGIVGETPGFYSIAADGEEKLRTGMNIPVDETVFRRVTDNTVEGAFDGVSVKMLDETDNVADVVTHDRFGTELAGFFLGAALVLLAVEMIIARKT